MRTGKDRVQVDAEQVPVNIGEARVAPGDLLRGDADGVVAIPRSREDAVLDRRGAHRSRRATDPRPRRDRHELEGCP